MSLLCIDLDDFKRANDRGGHRVGDAILIAVAGALAGQMRRGALVARAGGDEFAMLCIGLEAAGVAAVAERLIAAVAELRLPAHDPELRVGCSIGVSCHPADAGTEDDFVACADAAMYEAKRRGKNGWALFQQDRLRPLAESARGGCTPN